MLLLFNCTDAPEHTTPPHDPAATVEPSSPDDAAPSESADPEPPESVDTTPEPDVAPPPEDADGSPPETPAADPPPPADSPQDCLVSRLLGELGVRRPLAGAMMSEATAAAAPFDIEYVYITGGVGGAQPCSSCQSCSSAWWGCWQDRARPPGEYVRTVSERAARNGQIPMFTYYNWLYTSGAGEGAAEVGALADAARLETYLNDYRFFLQAIGQVAAFIHLEPDLWGYAQHAAATPHALPAPVSVANPTDCSGRADTVAGLTRCMLSMARRYAPNARVGLHASPWGTRHDIATNRQASLDVVAEADKLATFLRELGADAGDFIVTEASDRDAGYYASVGQDRYWHEDALPSFAQAFRWAGALSEALALPNLWWQLPVGNMSLPDQPYAWRDNRVDYFFAHVPELIAAHTAGFVFGAGAGGQTTPESDGGNLIAKVSTYAARGSRPLCVAE